MPKKETSLVYGKLTHPMKQSPLVVVVVVVILVLEEAGDVAEVAQAVALHARPSFR
jgi:hypothetical protein